MNAPAPTPAGRGNPRAARFHALPRGRRADGTRPAPPKHPAPPEAPRPAPEPKPEPEKPGRVGQLDSRGSHPTADQVAEWARRKEVIDRVRLEMLRRDCTSADEYHLRLDEELGDYAGTSEYEHRKRLARVRRERRRGRPPR